MLRLRMLTIMQVELIVADICHTTNESSWRMLESDRDGESDKVGTHRAD